MVKTVKKNSVKKPKKKDNSLVQVISPYYGNFEEKEVKESFLEKADKNVETKEDEKVEISNDKKSSKKKVNEDNSAIKIPKSESSAIKNEQENFENISDDKVTISSKNTDIVIDDIILFDMEESLKQEDNIIKKDEK